MKVDECDEAVHMHAQPLLTKLFCVFVRGQFYELYMCKGPHAFLHFRAGNQHAQSCKQ